MQTCVVFACTLALCMATDVQAVSAFAREALGTVPEESTSVGASQPISASQPITVTRHPWWVAASDLGIEHCSVSGTLDFVKQNARGQRLEAVTRDRTLTLDIWSRVLSNATHLKVRQPMMTVVRMVPTRVRICLQALLSSRRFTCDASAQPCSRNEVDDTLRLPFTPACCADGRVRAIP